MLKEKLTAGIIELMEFENFASSVWTTSIWEVKRQTKANSMNLSKNASQVRSHQYRNRQTNNIMKYPQNFFRWHLGNGSNTARVFTIQQPGILMKPKSYHFNNLANTPKLKTG